MSNDKTFMATGRSINQLIHEGRIKLGLTQQQFADAIGVTRGAVQQWESEGGTAPKRLHQPAVAKLLGISVAELMDSDSPTMITVSASDEVTIMLTILRARLLAIPDQNRDEFSRQLAAFVMAPDSPRLFATIQGFLSISQSAKPNSKNTAES